MIFVRTSLLFGTFPSRLQVEEGESIPFGAGDLMGGRRQGFVRPSQILEVVGAQHDLVGSGLSGQLG